MEQSTKKKLLIGGSLLVVAGVGGYFLLKYLKNKRDEEAKKKADADAAAAAAASAAANKPKDQTSTSVTVPKDAPADVLGFQKFANSKGYTPKLSEDGKWGAKTSAAWSKLKQDYNSFLSSSNMKFAKTYDLLASDISAANGKNLYTDTIALTSTNMDNQKGKDYPPNSLMGKIVSAKKGGNDYTVTFVDKDSGVKYYVLGKYTKIDMTPASGFDGMTVSRTFPKF